MNIDIQKWNYKTHQYDPYEVPENVTLVIYSIDMDLPINCAACFKPMTYGVGYTSRTLHNHVGFGYPVCEEDYEKEVEAEKASK
jgi:hypothetical protein